MLLSLVTAACHMPATVRAVCIAAYLEGGHGCDVANLGDLLQDKNTHLACVVAPCKGPC